MKSKSKIHILESDSFIYVAAMILFTVIIAVIRPIAVIPAVVIMLLAIFISSRLPSRRSLALNDYFEDMANEMDENIAAAVIYSPYPLCTMDVDGHIIWTNNAFKETFMHGERNDTMDIYDLTGVKLHDLTNEVLKDKTITVASINRSFKVQMTSGKQWSAECGDGMQSAVRMVHWIETTKSEELRKMYLEAWPCIALISIDNLDDIIANAQDDKKATIAGDIEKLVRQWAVRCQGAVIKRSQNSFVMFMDERNLQNSEANKFPVLDDVRALDTGTDIPASLSVGIGANGKTIAQTEEYAEAAMDLSQGRGGDQVVVRRGTEVNYYGGRLQTVEKRNKGKSRIVALALRQLIDQSPRVFVMGHKLPDMDSLGSALGVARFAKNRGKEVNIVIDTWDAVDMMYERAVEEGEYNFIRSDYAKLIIKNDDLLIVVDNHKPSISECGELTERVDRIVIIDHHRRGEEMIANPTLIHIEPYASSTSELVAEMLQYANTEKKDITHFEAEAMLAGIAVDTKNYTIKTGVRTFEAATWLRRMGADPTIVRQFFQTDIDIFRDRAQIIAQAKRLPGDIAISYSRGPKKNISVLISMAADELLNIRGMRASFVIGESDQGGLRVSARSLGDINVQMIMENIGGGGNLTTAGAQLDMNLDDALKLLEKVVLEQTEEKSSKEKSQKEKPAKENNGRDTKDKKDSKDKKEREEQ